VVGPRDLTCRTQADLEEFVTAYSYWVTVQSGTVNYNYNCPPAATTSTVTYKCLAGGSTEYQNVTYISGVNDGETESGAAYSNEATFPCV
jgi:hypothetical protein